MNPAFRHNFDAQKEDTTKHVSNHAGDTGVYMEAGNIRNICFGWLDGRRTFLNYSYLISGEYLPSENVITLYFTSQAFIIKGINLEVLFYDIMQQITRQVTCLDARYNSIGDDTSTIVNEIILKTAENSRGV